MIDSLLIEILRLAIQKTTEAYIYYEEQAKYCSHDTNRQFLLYLAENKKNKLLQIRDISQSAGINFYSIVSCDNNQFSYFNINTTQVFDSTLDEIYSFALSFGEKEVDFYKFLDGIKKNPLISILIKTLIELADDYIVEIKEGYIGFLSKSLTYKTDTTFNWQTETWNLVP